MKLNMLYCVNKYPDFKPNWLLAEDYPYEYVTEWEPKKINSKGKKYTAKNNVEDWDRYFKNNTDFKYKPDHFLIRLIK